ncbi:hypothetical membrane protein [Syntrophus aciditrophicus SB]|uniref:Hypothetical membrane protein n=1 Tax=Syntrophus aciditrophicus (strain SB) TaxID=56780 RepID=Q2LTV4_SYNAS|nr:hypothetical membrane protein [Syntrophus aciditrophicus SB]
MNRRWIIQQKPGVLFFILSFMGAQGYLPLSIFHCESLPTGEVMGTFDKGLIMDERAGCIRMSRTRLYGMTRRGGVGVMAARHGDG